MRFSPYSPGWLRAGPPDPPCASYEDGVCQRCGLDADEFGEHVCLTSDVTPDSAWSASDSEAQLRAFNGALACILGGPK